jgi:hypothetical protein
MSSPISTTSSGFISASMSFLLQLRMLFVNPPEVSGAISCGQSREPKVLWLGYSSRNKLFIYLSHFGGVAAD